MRRDGDRRREERERRRGIQFPLCQRREAPSPPPPPLGFLLKLSSSPSPLTSQFRQSGRREKREARTEKLLSGLSTSIFFPGRTQ